MRSIQLRRGFFACVSQRAILVAFTLLLFAQWGQATNTLKFFKNYFVTGDYVVGGVGLRGKGVGGFATGNITISGVPAGADIVAAFLYWETDESASSPFALNGFFNGQAMVGKTVGSPTSSSCTSGRFARVYRADVLRYLPVDAANSVRKANGTHTVKLPDSGSQTTYLTNGASLVVIYRVLTSATPLRAVVIYDGTYTLTNRSGAMSQAVAGFYQASSSAAAKMTQIVGNQSDFDRTTMSVNGTVISSKPFSGAQGNRWDNPTFNISLAQNAASYVTQVSTSDSDDCVMWGALVSSTAVTDSDGDGLLDIWETKGVHLNDQAFPATFGGCSDYPSEPCVNLPAMGASSTAKDIFVEMDWLHGNDGVDHSHVPKFDALNVVATTFSLHGIKLHFDVGNNYQQKGSPYIIPAAYAQGGEVVEESTLLCPNAKTSVCAFPNLRYAVQGWKIGFRAVKDGFQSLGIPAHFAHNRKDVFHYSLFSHALAIPFTPPNGMPKSVSGVADRPGGDFMITLGRWLSDDPPGCDPTTNCTNETGSVMVQAGTLMHELGHNLGLSHAGLYRVPNCIPNYPSVMNYLYQARGLIDGAGGAHVDYSPGLLPGLNENALTGTALGSTAYRVSFYGPLSPIDATLNRQAKLHCDGTDLHGDLAVRVDSPLGSIDWKNDGFKTPGPFALDIDFNGFIGSTVADSVDPAKALSDPTKRWLVDSNDWGNLNLRQVGARMNVSGLSADVGQTDLGQTDLGQTDLGQTDLGQTDLGQTDLGQTDLGQTDLGQTDLGDVDYETVISTIDATSSGTPLSATSTLTAITLNWGPPSIGQIRHYNIYRSDPANPTPALVAHNDGAPPAVSYVDAVNSSTTLYNIAYTYFISSVDINGTASGPSGTVNGIVKHLFIKANDVTRVYGDPNPSFTFTTTGLDAGLSGATVCTSTAVPTSNVGTYPITCSGLTPVAGVTYTSGTLTITPAPLSITAAANTKTYDGTTTAASIPIVTGLKNGDTVSGLVETYDNRNAGTGKTMSVTPGYTINDRNNGGNYTVTVATSTTGIINKAPLTITASTYTKTYDANTSAAATPVATGLQSTDTVTGLAESYDNKNAGSGKTLLVLPSYVVNDGNAGGNYIVTLVNNTTGVINRAPLTITALTNTKIFNGTTTAAAVPTVAGLQPGDTVTAPAETYDTAAVGTGKTLSVSAYTINDGNSGGNYTVTLVKDTSGVIISAAILSITNYQLVSSQPAAGGWSSLTYRADLLNFGKPLGGAIATLTSSDPFTIRTVPGQGTLNFGPILTNGQVTSTNTFTILVSPAGPVDFNKLQWAFQTIPAPPIANPGPNLTVPVGTAVPLDGSGSSNPSGIGTLSYNWVLTSRPPGSSPAWSYTTTVRAILVPDAPGNYVITLTVSNGSATGTATVTVTAVAP